MIGAVKPDHGDVARITVSVLLTIFAFVAQLVEQWIEDPRVGGSTPSKGTMRLGLSGVNREPAECRTAGKTVKCHL